MSNRSKQKLNILMFFTKWKPQLRPSKKLISWHNPKQFPSHEAGTRNIMSPFPLSSAKQSMTPIGAGHLAFGLCGRDCASSLAVAGSLFCLSLLKGSMCLWCLSCQLWYIIFYNLLLQRNAAYSTIALVSSHLCSTMVYYHWRGEKFFLTGKK